MIKIKVKYFAGYRTLKGKKEELLDVPGNSTILHLLEKANIPGGEGLLVLVNGIKKPKTYVLKEGDEAGIFPLIGGG